MQNMQKYYDSTESENPRNNLKYFINKIQCKASNAIELGCGAGNDTIYLIKNNWKVLAIDREDVGERIYNRLNVKEKEMFRFQKQSFENIELERTGLIVANYSLPFCDKDKFEDLWNKININIKNEGYFIGTFLGINDSWKENRPQMVFFSKEQVLELFRDFEILRFNEIEKDGVTALGKTKHWHIFDVIAKK